MKWCAIILLATICGCAGEQKPDPIPDTFKSLDDWQASASNRVRSWVPLGTRAVDAQQIMEQHQFTTFTNCPTLLGFYYRSSSSWKNPVEECITVYFSLNSGNVSGEGVTTYLKGP
jgi:hypothetical protein